MWEVKREAHDKKEKITRTRRSPRDKLKTGNYSHSSEALVGKSSKLRGRQFRITRLMETNFEDDNTAKEILN